MEPGVLIFLTLIGFLGLGLVGLRLHDAASAIFPRYVGRSRAPEPAPEPPRARAPEAPEPASERRSPAIAERAPDDGDLTEGVLRLTWQEIVAALANVEMLDDAGQAAPLSKKRLAALVGRRQEDVAAVVDQARGAEPPDPANALRVRDQSGERLIAR